MRGILLQTISQPASFLHSVKDKWLFILVINVFSPAFLIAFQPYGVNNYDPTHSLDTIFVFSMLSFGVINGFSMAVNEFLVYRLIFRKPMTYLQLAGWLTWTVVFISGTTFLWYNVLGGFHDWSGLGYLKFLRDVGMMGILPMTGILLYFHNRSAKEKISELIELKPLRTKETQLIFLEAENGKEKIGITINTLAYLEAQDNYVAVYSIEGSSIKKNLLRTTLKKMEDLFRDFPVVRCHRSYMVNLAKVEKVMRKGQQLKLQVEHISIPIPVSRSYDDSFSELLSKSSTPH